MYANEANNDEINEDMNTIETETVEEIQDAPKVIEEELGNEEIQLKASANLVIGYHAFLDAASRVKEFARSYGRLPSYIQVYDQNTVIYMSMPDFLYNAAQFLDHYVINGGQFYNQIITLGFSNPLQPSGVSINGRINSSNFSKYEGIL